MRRKNRENTVRNTKIEARPRTAGILAGDCSLILEYRISSIEYPTWTIVESSLPSEDCMTPNRDDAWSLLCEFTQNENLRKHALAVEACVRAYARKNGADEELWSLTALLHDFDYERWPNNGHHPA